MPRKTQWSRVHLDSRAAGFNEAAARCRGKPAADKMEWTYEEELQ